MGGEPAGRVCPLLSINWDTYVECLRERCKWYIPSLGMCAVELIAYSALGKALLNIKGAENRAEFLNRLRGE